jgi:hypothetical protein
MSRYSGRQAPGAARLRREQAWAEAQARNAATPTERTAAFRRQRARIRQALDERERAALRDALSDVS